MTGWTFIFRSLKQHYRIHFAVMLGVAAATAVLTGALLVGDSMRGSLRDLTLDRLGKIDEVLVADRFFRQELAEELAATDGFSERFSQATPLILFPTAAVETGETGAKRRASGVLTIGCSHEFWQLNNSDDRYEASDVSPRMLGDDEVVINEPLAAELGITVAQVTAGEAMLTLRFPQLEQVPAENPLGKKDDTTARLVRQKVVAIIPATGLGQFSLHPRQTTPLNLFTSLSTLQNALDHEGHVNAIVVAGIDSNQPTTKEDSEALASMLKPSFADFGFLFTPANESFEDETVFDYESFSSERMVLGDEVRQVASQAFATDHGQPVMSYLANAIAIVAEETVPKEGVANESDDDERESEENTGTTSDVGIADDAGIPYSTVAGIDWTPQFHPTDMDGKPLPDLGDDEIVLNEWAAKDLAAKVGDQIRIAYFEPESTDRTPVERYADFRLAAITPLTEPVKPYGRGRPRVFDAMPTIANDPNLIPHVPGVTDAESIDDWDVPFAMNRTLRGVDDDYWRNHRTTPKAFVSLATGEKLWGSRFGSLTSYRIPKTEPDQNGLGKAELQAKFIAQADRDGEKFGLQFLPIKRMQLEASSGATPFDILFLSLSMFIIAAAIALVMLLFRLGIEQRASEIGLLIAVGIRRKRALRWFVGEGVFVAAAGGVIGVALGIAYAALMIHGLTTWWIGAVSAPFLELHITVRSLAIGFISGLILSALSIAWTMRAARKISPRSLLAGESTSSISLGNDARGAWWALLLAILFTASGIALSMLAGGLGGEAQAGAFLGSGAAILAAGLFAFWFWLRTRSALKRKIELASLKQGWPALAIRSGDRNPVRGVMTVGLLASAVFLIIAVSSFHLEPTESGIGGFEFIATSSEPIYDDLSTKAGRQHALGDLLADYGEFYDDPPESSSESPDPESESSVVPDSETTNEDAAEPNYDFEDRNRLYETRIIPLRMKGGDDASCSNLYKAAQPRVLGVTPAMIQHFEPDGWATPFTWAASESTDEPQGDKEEQGTNDGNPWRLLATATPAGEATPVVLDKNTAMYSLQLYGGIGEEFSIDYPDRESIRYRVVGLLANSIMQGSLLIGEDNFKRLFPEAGGFRYFLISSNHGDHEEVASKLEDQLSDQGFDTTDSKTLLAQLLAVQNTYLSTFQALGSLGLLLGVFGLAAVQLRSVFERRGELALLRAVGFRRWRLAEIILLENVFWLLAGLLTGVVAAAVAVSPQLSGAGASVPIRFLAYVLLGIFVSGMVVGMFAVRATLKAPLVGALRGD